MNLFHIPTAFVFGFATSEILNMTLQRYQTNKLYNIQFEHNKGIQEELRNRLHNGGWSTAEENYHGQLMRWRYLQPKIAIHISPEELLPLDADIENFGKN